MGWKVDIEKQLGTEFWTNVYYVNAESITAAAPIANEIVQAERAISHISVQFRKFRISDIDPETELFFTQVLNVIGLRGTATNYPIPLFNVVRADLSTATGRPSRKYLRGVLCETDILGNGIEVTTLGEISVAYGDALEAIEELVDVDDQPFTAVTINPFVAMRQLRRGSRRRTIPVLP